MAEVVSKKSINVVSTNKKNNEVCSVVQSNNGLDNITTCSSNNQLISLCDKNDDDEDELLVLANNTRNERDSDEKSLQELIESELALRICSTNQATDSDVHMDPESSLEEQLLVSEVKRIVLDPCRQDENRITADFIANEVQHCLIEPYSYQNGHTFSENIESFQNFDQQLGEEIFAEPEISDLTVVHKTNTDSNDRSTSCDDVGLLSHDDSDLEDHHGSNLPSNDTDQNNECPNSLDLMGDSNDPQADKAHFSILNQKSELQKEEHIMQTQSTEYSHTWNPQDVTVETFGRVEDVESSRCDDVDSASLRKEEYTEISESEFTSEIIVVQKQEIQFDCSPDSVSTEEFIDTERRVLNDESPLDFQEEDRDSTTINTSQLDSDSKLMENEETVFIGNDHSTMDQQQKSDFDCWLTVEEVTNSTEFSSSEIVNSSCNVNETIPIVSVTETIDEHENEDSCISSSFRAPLATPDDETSDLFNTCDSETREETITTTSSLVTTSSKTSGTKTKKKKIEGVTGNDTSPNLTPRIKKTKKNKKNELEKENISVNCNLQDPIMHTGSRQLHPEMINFSNEDDLSNVDVKSLTQNYVSETIRNEQERSNKERIATGISIKELCRSFVDISNMNDADQTIERTNNLTVDNNEKSSFNKFDALSKKNILHVRSVDAGKVQQQLNAVGQNGDTNPNCRSCGKVVFQMEQTKAEGLAWHKNCFRCVQCSKQLNVDNYESHESTLYCKAHFKELFQPKPVEEADQPASDKPDLGLEELSNLNVKSRFQVFEKANESTNEIEKSPSQVAVKRSPSILSKLAKFQAKGMDIGVADESLNGIPYEESSESEEEEEETEETEEVETEIIKAKRTTRERPISFSKMDDIKNRWETTTQQGRRETQREARKEEIAGIRSRLFMGKQGKMKEMYQQAVAESERVTKINAAEEIQHTIHARSIKERFERGEPIVATSDDEGDSKPKVEKADEEVIAAGISRKSRSLFLELDASAAKTGRPITPVNPKTPSEAPRRARDMDSPEREIYRDPGVVRADDRIDEVVHTDTARKMLSIFRQMEENAAKEELPEGPKPLKRFTPPPEDKFAKQTASESDEDEEEEEAEESESEESGEDKDPNYVRASDKVEDEFLKQAQTAARAKALRAKFEHWEETDGKVTNHHVAEMELAQSTVGDQSSIESASSLRARFESLGSQTNEQTPRTPKVKVNRFVEIQSSCMDACESCEKRVYPLEKVETNNKIFHKQCFRCLQCNCILRMDTFTLNNGKLYCIPHFKQLFITRGNYDEGFGVDPHKNKWSTNGSATVLNASPIVVSNGDA